MTKRIVMGLDTSDYTKTALQNAFSRAKVYDSVVVGIVTIDVKRIKHDISKQLGGAIYAAETNIERHINTAQTRAEELIHYFQLECQKHKVEYESYTRTGHPAEEIIEEGRTADLIIAGIRTFYHLDQPTEPGDTLKHLLKASVCPVLAVTKEAVLPENILITYDGSIHSANAIREFAHIHTKLAKLFKKVILLNINENSEEGMAILSKAEQFLKLYSFQGEKIVRSGKPSEVIYKIAQQPGKTLVVMGAYGKSGLSDLFFGSTAKEIIEDGKIPLFVYH